MPEKRKITKKVISKKPAPVKEVREVQEVEEEETKPHKRKCSFCQSGQKPEFTDTAALKKYLSDRGKIIPAAKSGVCSKHQRQVTRAVKHARILSLLPFTPKV